MANQTRVHHFRLVNVLVIVVVLNTRQGFFDARFVNERSADPIVDETVRDPHRRLPRPKLSQDVSFAEVTGTIWIPVRPQAMSASIQRRFHSCFGFPNSSEES